jgi:hypothetical protein
MCFSNVSFPSSCHVETGNRSRSGVGHGRVTIREETGRIVSITHSSCCSGPIHHCLVRSSCRVFPADQLRDRAHCYRHSQLKRGPLCEFHHNRRLGITNFLPFQGKIAGSGTAPSALPAHRCESRTPPSLSRSQQFVQGGRQAEAGHVIMRHFRHWSSQNITRPAFEGELGRKEFRGN